MGCIEKLSAVKSLFTLILLLLLMSYSGSAPAEEHNVTIISTKALCKEPGRYIGWPTITKTHNEKLYVVFSGDRDAHVCPWGKTQMVWSNDLGTNWRVPATINNTPLDDRDAGIIETKEGTFLVSWFTSLAFETYPEWYKHAQKVTPEIREKWLGSWVRRSVDGGETWEDPVRITGSTPHGPIQLRDGRILYVGKGSPNNQLSITVEESHDDGRSWKLIATIPIPSDESIAHYHEPHVVEMNDGKLIVMIRQHTPDYAECYLRQSESTDGGRTWSVAHKTPMWGFPPHIIQLKNGWLLVVYGRRFPPFGQRACISRDGGKTWDINNEIVLSNAINNDLGYPSSAQLSDGSIWTVYYQIDKPGETPCLMGTHWRIK